MENSATRLKRYAESLKKFRHPGNKIGCIVMNANPFTNGHRYLIQPAAAQCDWLHLFLVKEDSSRFPYEDRLDLVLKGTADIPRLIITPHSAWGSREARQRIVGQLAQNAEAFFKGTALRVVS